MNSEKMPHTGNMLRKKVEESGLSKVSVARKLGVTPATLFGHFNAESVSVQTLWKMSQVLDRNLLFELSEMLPIVIETKREVELKDEIGLLNKEIEQLKMKIEIFEAIIKR